MKKTNNSLTVAAAAIVGAVVGGAVGILLAPNKGSDTRKKIMSAGENLSDSMKDEYEEVVDAVKKEIGTMKQKGHVLVENGLSKAEALKKESQLS